MPHSKKRPQPRGGTPNKDTKVDMTSGSITVASEVVASSGSIAGLDGGTPAAASSSLAKSADEAVRLAGPVVVPSPKINDISNGNAVIAAASKVNEYEHADLDDITLRQLAEDISAYNHDLEFCQAQLHESDLTPQEARTLQLRSLDLNHQIRHCQNRIEIMQFQLRKPAFSLPYVGSGAYRGANGIANGASGIDSANGKRAGLPLKARPSMTPSGKRLTQDADDSAAKRLKKQSSPVDDDDVNEENDGETPVTALQRLGFWKCRLCSAPKYLLAGAGRSPAAPCKWPLKDISKMITHFTEMHTEHPPPERCAELGDALDMNRGPFEYWIRRTRAQNVSDSSVIDECIDNLRSGRMPGLLRRLSRAAAGMPTA